MLSNVMRRTKSPLVGRIGGDFLSLYGLDSIPPHRNISQVLFHRHTSLCSLAVSRSTGNRFTQKSLNTHQNQNQNHNYNYNYNQLNYQKQLLLFQFRKFSSSSTKYTKNTKMSEGNGSACRQNYTESSEALVNKQINLELYASYVYMSMAYYFDRDDVALEGFHKFFKKSSAEENEHAQKLMKYQNSRGGRLVYQSIAKPTTDEWTSPLHAMQTALDLEKTVNQSLLDLHSAAGRDGDPHLCDFLETEFLDEQVKSIQELAKFVTQLKRVGSGLGEHIFDKELGGE